MYKYTQTGVGDDCKLVKKCNVGYAQNRRNYYYSIQGNYYRHD